MRHRGTHKFLYIPALLLMLLVFSAGLPGCGQNPAPAEKIEPKQDVIPEPPFQLPPRGDVVKFANRPELILFIIIDTLRADYVGAYGSKRGLTPSLDLLARASCVFDRAVATSSWTRASIASMFTSCFPGSIGVEGREDVLSEDLLTLAEILKVHGNYQCIGITTNGNAGEAVGFGQGFDIFIKPDMMTQYPDDRPVYPAEGVVAKADELLREWHHAPEETKKPLFMFLHFIDPHAPYMPHPGILAEKEPPGRFNGSMTQLVEMDKLPKNELTADDVARIDYLYSGEIKYCDQAIGELLLNVQTLEKIRKMSSMVVVTADHGEGLWTHEFRDHGNDLYEEQIHVPLIIRFPGMKVDDMMRIANPVSLIDVPATLLSYCGINAPPQFMGHDLSPLLQGLKRGDAHNFVYSELNVDKINLESMILKNQKVIRNRDVPPHQANAFHYYDLKTDPREQNNMAVDPDARVKWSGKMKKALRKWGDAVKADERFTQRIDMNSLDKETLDNLRALGYLGTGKESDKK